MQAKPTLPVLLEQADVTLSGVRYTRRTWTNGAKAYMVVDQFGHFTKLANNRNAVMIEKIDAAINADKASMFLGHDDEGMAHFYIPFA
jgi:hypothetical protein